MIDTVFANFMDGENARVQRVRVEIIDVQHPTVLRIFLPDDALVVDWVLSDLRSIPDQAERKSIVLGQAGDHPARLMVSNPALAARLHALCPDLRRKHKDPNVAKRLVKLTVGAFASVALIVFVLVPLMADQLATMLPPEGEKAFGDTTFEQIRKGLNQSTEFGLPICEEPEGQAALEKMLARLNPGTDFPYEISLHVLDHPMINAFALPGGHIVLFRGLLQDATSAEEVAGILGHEMGHVDHRDPTRLALRSAGSAGVLGLLLGDFAGGTVILLLTEKLIQAQYSRGAEAASDTYAHALLSEVGLPTAPMADFFVRLRADGETDQGLLSHLASHPDTQGRADAAIAANKFGSYYDPILTPIEWQALRQICGD
ncbi:MAG: Zn-dependent protease with chaperone function [Paracoccaceae bacterium]|jgi:Zn-dependent protease with chaperone function